MNMNIRGILCVNTQRFSGIQNLIKNLMSCKTTLMKKKKKMVRNDSNIGNNYHSCSTLYYM